MSELSKLLSQEGKKKYAEIEKWFDEIAYQLMNYYCLKVGDSEYRITECEIYYNDKESPDSVHPDPFVHGELQQLTNGNIYFHGLGIDLTFGSEEQRIFGGILIRGIRNLDETKKHTSGPYNLIVELFSAFGNVLKKKPSFFIEAKELADLVEKPIKAARFGLNKKIENNEYRDKPYRYIVEITKEHDFVLRSQIVNKLYKENKISKEITLSILNYTPNK
jgi:3-methyladenine DNA glycosylase Mpg